MSLKGLEKSIKINFELFIEKSWKIKMEFNISKGLKKDHQTKVWSLIIMALNYIFNNASLLKIDNSWEHFILFVKKLSASFYYTSCPIIMQ